MSALVLRFAEHVHGHLAWLSTLALYHPALMLRRGRWPTHFLTSAATALVTLTVALGAWLYPAYRAQVKPRVFALSSGLGNAFERKEHLAMAILVLAWTGLVAHGSARHDRASSPALRQLAFVSYALAAALATLTASLGLTVAAHIEF